MRLLDYITYAFMTLIDLIKNIEKFNNVELKQLKNPSQYDILISILNSKGKKSMKKPLSVILFTMGYTLSSMMFPINDIQINAESTETINNLVVFAQFNDVNESNFMEQHTNDIISMCNDTSTQRSLKSYINTISYGQATTNCYFPQMENNVIVPYQLEHSKEDYLNSETLAIEILNNIDVPTDINLDGNNDNIIDNIIIVVDGQAETVSDIFWPKALYVGGLTINNLFTGYVNIQNSYSLFENSIFGGVGVLCHEFLHSLQYPDLYRNPSREGNPVGMWDIMAADSIFLQYPLAYQRANISNWLEPVEITKNGTYTLNSVAKDNGNRLYLLKSPLSETEFFAVEYRVQGARYSEEMDTKIYGTGLVVYRINTECKGNYRSDNDQIYVFRPNEIELNAGNGDISLSCYGGENAPNEVGSLNLQDDISKNALVFSNGVNSGIKISDITLNGDEATFNVEFADVSQFDIWEPISNNFQDNFYLDMDTHNNTPYILTSDGLSATVSYLNSDDEWVSLNKIGSNEYGSVNNPKLVICDGVPYVMFNDYDFNLNLYSYDSNTQSWNLVYRGDEIAQYTDIISHDDKVYVAYTTGNYPYSLNVISYDTTSKNIETIGTNLGGNACNISMSYYDNTILLAYRDLDDNTSKLLTYSNDIWDNKSISNNDCSTISSFENLIITKGTTNQIYQFKDGSLTEINLPNDINGSIFEIVPVIYNNDIYLAINTQNPDDFSVYKLSDNSLQKLGNNLIQEVVNCPNMIYSNNNLYVGYISSNRTLNIKKYPINKDIKNDTLLGDLNFDNSISSLDIMILKKYLLGVSTLTDTQITSADLNLDGSINSLDFVLLKELLITQD